ncbi:MAG: tetratricopeptide repeat protein [Flavobacteriales bacterium]|nr:tetratricopeptide repeat protein [Flavobacteriales bacterium]
MIKALLNKLTLSSHHLVFLVSCCWLLFAQPGLVSAQQHVDEELSVNISEIKTLLADGKSQRKAGGYDVSFESLSNALHLSKLSGNRPLIANSLSELGVTRMYQGRYSDALEFFHEGMLIQEAMSDSAGMADSYNYIASVHHAQTDYSIAIKYYNKSLSIREHLGDSVALGVLYNNLGTLYADQGDFDLGLQYHTMSMSIWKAVKDTSWIAVSLRHIGDCSEGQGKIEEALASYKEGYRLSVQKGTRMNVIKASMPIGNLYLKMNEPEKALEWCDRAYSLSLEEGNNYGIQESCLCLSEIFDGLNKPDKALDYYRMSIKARDSIYGHARTKELTRLEMNFVFERQQLADSLKFVKTQIIQEKHIQNQRIGLASIGFVLLMMGALAVVIYRGKRKSDHLLLNILPAKIAEELKTYGTAKAKRLDNVTVLFTDFSGFTSLSELMSPEELVNEIHQCFSYFDRVMGEFGIEKIKTIGDAYMAASGVPSPKETHAQDAVSAAIKIQKFMLDREAEKKAKGEQFFQMRVGIHTGTVVAGIVGQKKFQYDIWGDAVNVAARMESSGEVGKVNVSETTYQLLKDDAQFTFESRGKIKAKGKGEMEMYFVV